MACYHRNARFDFVAVGEGFGHLEKKFIINFSIFHRSMLLVHPSFVQSVSRSYESLLRKPKSLDEIKTITGPAKTICFGEGGKEFPPGMTRCGQDQLTAIAYFFISLLFGSKSFIL